MKYARGDKEKKKRGYFGLKEGKVEAMGSLKNEKEEE